MARRMIEINRDSFKLCTLEGYSLKRIAMMFGVNPQTLRNRVKSEEGISFDQWRDKLRKQLEEHGE